MATEVEIAWAAGLFEGEGSCGVSRRGQPVVQLTMTDEDPIRRFAQIVSRGTVLSYEPYTGGRKATWRWNVQQRDDVLHVLGQLWPFLGMRRQERATEVIERAVKIGDGAGFCTRGHDLSQSENIYMDMKRGQRQCRICRDERGRVRRARL